MTDKIAILIVEDEPLILLDIAQQIEAEGYIVFEASNADDAIRVLIENAGIRLIFTDIDMPGSFDGLKLAAAVRKRWPPVKIIVTSGARLVEIFDMPDGSAFFGKPYNHAAVLGSMHRMLNDTTA